MPYNSRFVAVHGFITDVLLLDSPDAPPDSDPIIDFFKITVESLEFLGAEPASSATGTLPNTLDSGMLVLFFFFSIAY